MAVPGAGKSRTIKEAAKAYTYEREKFRNAHPLIKELREIAGNMTGAPKTYEAGKNLFEPSCRQFLLNLLDEKGYTNTNTNDVSVYHFDEIQLLMGDSVVSSKDTEQSEDAFDYVMPAFGDAVDDILSTHKNLRIALSGTNFFTELVFNSGSDLKVEPISLEGGFPLEWSKKLLQNHFSFESVEEEDQNAIIGPLCANRRALHFLGRELQWAVGIGGMVTKEILSKAAVSAYDGWSSPIARCIGAARKSALSLLALITFPKVWLAYMDNGKLCVPANELPQVVKQYALGGGVNMSYREASKLYALSIPTGCTMRLLTQLCNKVTTGDNMKEYEAFRLVSRSVDTDKGHLFERMVACELTFVSSELYKTLLSSTCMEDADPDPRTLGKNFVYDPKIHEADWSAGNVCVDEDQKNQGRLVDVGFPVTHGMSSWKVFCELKVVQDSNKLWRMCWRFFQNMEGVGVGKDGNCTIAVFLSFHEFLTHNPDQRQTKEENMSAHDSRLKVLALLQEKSQYFAVVDATKLKNARTVLPLVDLYDVIDSKAPTDIGVTELSRGVAQVYHSESQTAPAMKQSEHKKLKIR